LEAPAVLFSQFMHNKLSGSIMLILCTAAAMIWANSAWGDSYQHFWHTPLTIGLGSHALTMGLSHWINDALMVVFFLYVGLEIKRELLVGELSSLKRSLLPIMAALGGMLFPAAVYFFFNGGARSSTGWGIPMATDIAFSLGVLALLGARVPIGIRVFLSALAIVDDLGAVVVIALFYNDQINWGYLGAAIGLLALLYFLLRIRYRIPILATLVGIAVWLLVLQSGIHATIAGVLLALVIPATTRINSAEFIHNTEQALGRFKGIPAESRDTFRNPDGLVYTQQIRQAATAVETPLQRVEHSVASWVAFAIMPVFALANAGVHLHWDKIADEVFSPVSLGVALGLIVGKQAGVTFFSWLSIRTGMASLPRGTSMPQIYAVSWLCGIGFTMSLFVSELAFTDPAFKETAKIGILLGSIISGLVGFYLLKWILPANAAEEVEAVHQMAPDVDLQRTQGWSQTRA
ncbi:MAG: Na+/H+ antiporter NhaA, partial [Sphingobacteriia bacterium]